MSLVVSTIIRIIIMLCRMSCNSLSCCLAGVVVGSSVVLTLTEDPRPVCVSLRKPGEGAALVSLTLVPTDSGKRLEKLSARDPKVGAVS